MGMLLCMLIRLQNPCKKPWTKRRVVVPFDAGLRALTEAAAADVARVFASSETPPPTPLKARCRACSLHDLCRPEAVARPARAWRDRMVAAEVGPR